MQKYLLILVFFVFSDAYSLQNNPSLKYKLNLAKLQKPHLAKTMQQYENSSYLSGGYMAITLISALGNQLEYLPYNSIFTAGFTLLAFGFGILSLKEKRNADTLRSQLIEWADWRIAYQSNADNVRDNNPGYDLFADKSAGY